MKLLKIDIDGKDCTNIYYVADTFISGGVITSSNISFKNDYRLVLRITVIDGVQRKQKKKVFLFNKNQTLLKSLAIMQKEKHSLKDELLNGDNIYRSKIPSLNEVWKIYIENKKAHLSDQTYKSYLSFYNNHLFGLGKSSIDKINTENLQTIVNRLLTEPKNDSQKQRSPRTAKTLKEILRPLFENELHKANSPLTYNPVISVKIPKYDNTVQVDLSLDQIKDLNKAIREYHKEPFRSIFIWATNGRRINEVLSLKWQHINVDKRTYTIVSPSNKARRNMTYTLRGELLSTLQVIGLAESGYIFHSVNDKSKKMNSGSLKRHWKAILDDANINYLRLHDLRHILGGELVSNGASLEQVAAVLGHTSTAITKRYSEVRKEVANEALDDFFKRVSEC